MAHALPNDNAELSQVTPQRVDQLGPLAHQKVARSEYHGHPLRLGALRRDEPHGRPLRRFADRLRIGHVVLLPLHERLHIGRRNQPRLADSSAPISRAQ